MHGGDAAIQGMQEEAKGAGPIERNGLLNDIEEAKKKNEHQKPPPPQGRKPMSKPSILALVDKEREFKNKLVVYSG